MNELQDIKRIPIGSFERNGSFRFLSAKIIILFVYSLWNETNEYLSSFAIAHERIILSDKSQPIYFPILTLMIYILPYDLALLWTFFQHAWKSQRQKLILQFKNRIHDQTASMVDHLFISITIFCISIITQH